MIYRKARKSYSCCSCGGTINVGEMYCLHTDKSKECRFCIDDWELASQIEGKPHQ